MRAKPCLTALLVVTCAATADAQEPPRPATVTREQLAPDLHVLLGTGGGQVAGNVLVLLGDDGALVVDTGYSQYVPLYREEIARLGGGAIRYAIDTHWHDDHSEGNKVLGPDGTLIVAHASSRTMLMRDNKINVVRTILDQPAFPPAAWPVVTFDDRLDLYLNGERHRARARIAGAHGRRRRRDLARAQRRAHGRRVPVGRLPVRRRRQRRRLRRRHRVLPRRARAHRRATRSSCPATGERRRTRISSATSRCS